MRFSTAVAATCLVGALAVSAPVAAAPILYTATLSGPQEAPPNASPGTGSAQVTIDTTAHTLEVTATFAGLLAPTTASHIHAPTPAPFTGTAGVATMLPAFTNFPLGATSGTMPPTVFNLTSSASFNPAFVSANGGTPAGAEAALAAALAGGRAYFNIHTSQFPGGEIRGFLAPVPEPGTLLLLATGIVAGSLRRRRSR